MPELRRFAWSLFGLALWLVAPKARAWGDEGHRVVGEIAWRHLGPAARQAVTQSLSEPGYATLAEAATWPDTYARLHHEYDALKPFHYVNVAADADAYVRARDCPNGCVVMALEQWVTLLGRHDPAPSADERRSYIYWIAHLVGDIHQPLHVAHPDGRGGTATLLTFFGESAQRSAHWIWDVGLIERRPLARGDYRVLADALLSGSKPEQLRAWQRTTSPEALANEALRLGKRHAFARAGQQVDDAYERTRWPIVAEQLLKAGVRLAAILDRSLGSLPR